jgi:intracellular sulfur oxidation DsrE/DsrF family protein
MIAGYRRYCTIIPWIFFTLTLLALVPSLAMAEGYGNALKGVYNYNAVFEVSQADPKVANAVFWAVRNAYQAPEVKAIAKAPSIAVVFHGPAVKLLSSDQDIFTDEEWAEVTKFQDTLRQMKGDGVKLEVCLYAVKLMGLDKTRLIPEIEQVDNGFVSVIGYQMQDYGVVRIP